MFLSLIFANTFFFASLATYHGELIDILFVACFGILTVYLIWQMIRKKKTAPRWCRPTGLVLVVFGFIFWATDFRDWNNAMMSWAVITSGFWCWWFAPKKEEKTNISVEPTPKPENEASAVQTSTDLNVLFQKVINLPSVRAFPEFLNTLQKTQSLYNDLINKEIRIGKVLTDQIEKLLMTYLDLDDDPVQTQKSLELKGQIRSGFSTIEEALENIYDKDCSTKQIDLESDIAALEMKLRQEGLLDSDFVIKDSTK